MNTPNKTTSIYERIENVVTLYGFSSIIKDICGCSVGVLTFMWGMAHHINAFYITIGTVIAICATVWGINGILYLFLIRNLKRTIVSLYPVVTENEISKADQEKIIEVLLGTWIVTHCLVEFRPQWTFHKDGSITSTAGSRDGVWKLQKTRIIIFWSEKNYCQLPCWDSFNLPLDITGTKGDSWLGPNGIFATKET